MSIDNFPNTEDYPDIVVDERGYLRVRFKNGEMLPEYELQIRNSAGTKDKKLCEVTVSFLAVHKLTNKEE